MPFGNYWVHEAAPSGYAAAPDQAVTISGSAATASLTFVNTRNPATVILHKQDDAGVAMPNVTFTLHNDLGTVGGTRGANDTIVDPGKSCTTVANGNCIRPSWRR